MKLSIQIYIYGWLLWFCAFLIEIQSLILLESIILQILFYEFLGCTILVLIVSEIIKRKEE